MKCLLIAESRGGRLLDSIYELLGFTARLDAESAVFLVGSESLLPACGGRLYLVDAGIYGEYNPEIHKALILEAIHREGPDYCVFHHSSYGSDLAPRIAASLGAAQVSEVAGLTDDGFEVPCLNGKMRRRMKPARMPAVLTIQAGAFAPLNPGGHPETEHLQTPGAGTMEFLGYESAESNAVDLGKARIIVAAGRGVGRKENMREVATLAELLGGEVGASRPVVDAGWLERGRQVGSSGQTVAPVLYVACGISGAIQHLAGMKQSEFIIAINSDRDAPIGEVADVMVVADVIQLIPVLIAKLKKAET